MLIKIVTASGKVVREPFNAERLPAAGETYRCAAVDYEVQGYSTDDSGQNGAAPITIVTVVEKSGQAGKKQAHGKKQLNG